MHDPIADLAPTRADLIFKSLRGAAFGALHKAGFAPKKKPAPGGDCPECGGSMAEHAPPPAQQAKPPVKKPVSGTEVAAAGGQALGEPEDEADAIEALDAAAGDTEAAAEDEADAIEDLDEDGEPDDEELPPDDGENHGVGDLNQDGTTESLVAEVTKLETAYYAAKGLHGDGPKAMVVLDRFHRAVRKLVHAVAGTTPQTPGAEEGEEDAIAALEGEQDPSAKKPGASAPPTPPGAKKPPATAGKEAGGNPGAKGTAGGDEKPSGGKPPVVASAPKKIEGDTQEEPDEVAPKFKKSLASFTSYSSDAPVPDEYLIDYFAAFVEEAFEEERREQAHQWTVMTPMDWAACVKHEFVLRLPRNENFRRLASRYKVDTTLIAAMLLEMKLVKPGGDMVGLDGGGNGYGNEPISILPTDNTMKADMRPGRALAARPDASSLLAPSDAELHPFAVMQKSNRAEAQAMRERLTGNSPIAVPTLTTAQVLERQAMATRVLLAANHFNKLG
jgi:hypothetical protein